MRKIWRRLLCRLFKHVPEEFTISACSPIITGIRCKRCGEQREMCPSCGERPSEATLRDANGNELGNLCWRCVGVP